MSPAWGLLALAGLFEVVWAVALKLSQGFTRPLPSLVVPVAAGFSFWLLARAMTTLPAGTAYAVWVGVGAVGVAIVGAVWLAEPATPLRWAGLVLVVAGIGLLKLG